MPKAEIKAMRYK